MENNTNVDSITKKMENNISEKHFDLISNINTYIKMLGELKNKKRRKIKMKIKKRKECPEWAKKQAAYKREWRKKRAEQGFRYT